METWFTQIERHISTLGILAIIGFILKQYKVWNRMKSYTNEMWFNYCGERQKLFVPVENGANPMIPPRPSNFNWEREE